MSAATSSAAAAAAVKVIRIRWLGREPYVPLWRRMQDFTEARSANTPDEIWFAEHAPVFTMGLNAAHEHLLTPGDIPVVDVDRGGQVTYHGPGQLMIYPLIDLRRAGLGVRDIVTALEQAAIDSLADAGIAAVCRKNAPGVYVNERKVASVGLRIRRGCSYHGMAFNVDMDIEPFSRINPCGYRGLEVTDLARLGVRKSLQEMRDDILPKLLDRLDFEDRTVETI